MDYLSKLLYIPQVDKDDNIIKPVERWEAHEKGILHRAHTVLIRYQDQIVLQHRKHPVFNDVFDATISSHPLYIKDQLEDMMTAVYRTLEREWHIKKEDLNKQPTFESKIYYQAHDPHSKYQEHEICHIYSCEIKEITVPDFECAYGFSLQPEEKIKDVHSPLYPLLAPWVKEMINQKAL